MTRERNCARSVGPIAAMMPSSFCPVKYVLKNSSRVMPSRRCSRSLTALIDVAIGVEDPSRKSFAPFRLLETT
jgi:hypothetical protein